MLITEQQAQGLFRLASEDFGGGTVVLNFANRVIKHVTPSIQIETIAETLQLIARNRENLKTADDVIGILSSVYIALPEIAIDTDRLLIEFAEACSGLHETDITTDGAGRFHHFTYYATHVAWLEFLALKGIK